ncbi:MAG TPA: hypothetical protein DDX91_08730 [Ruminococcaceae bacterium]|nr:hypothetical protein [Oscillospiraceae bacterium]
MNFWDRAAGFYDFAQSFNKRVYAKMTRMVTELVPGGAKVLDCAAGTGELSLAAAKKAETVICTDFSEKMLKRAHGKAKKQNADNIVFEQGDICSLKYGDESFDCVIAGNILHLLDEPQKAVTELLRVTKKGGILLLPTFLSKSTNPMIKVYRLFGFRQKAEYTAKQYSDMLKGCRISGKIKISVIKGRIPCCFAAIKKF